MTNQITVRDYFKNDEIVQSFKNVLGDGQANAFVASVLIAVANSQALQECNPVSVVTSAMRAATLRLSVDPGTGQAYLVPFKGKCTLIIGYRGLKDLALRTGKYRYLNVGSVFEGEEVIEDRLTGMHSITGAKTSSRVIGRLLYFELVSGFRKTFYMTVEEIHEHAKRYSKNYDREDSVWKTNRPLMEQKTVLRLGLGRWGYFEPNDMAVMSQVEAEGEEEAVESEFSEVEVEPQPEAPKKTEQEVMHELGF